MTDTLKLPKANNYHDMNWYTKCVCGREFTQYWSENRERKTTTNVSMLFLCGGALELALARDREGVSDEQVPSVVP